MQRFRRGRIHLINNMDAALFDRLTVEMPSAAHDAGSSVESEQMWFNQFRVGTWPDMFPGVQFSDKPEVLNQYFRSMTPNTGPFDANVVSDATSALFDRIGDGILFTHFAGRRAGLADSDQEPAGEGHRVVRTGQRVRVPRRGGAAADPQRLRHRRRRVDPEGAVQRPDEDSDRHLLRRQHPQRTDQHAGAGQLACPHARRARVA